MEPARLAGGDQPCRSSTRGCATGARVSSLRMQISRAVFPVIFSSPRERCADAAPPARPDRARNIISENPITAFQKPIVVHGSVNANSSSIAMPMRSGAGGEQRGRHQSKQRGGTGEHESGETDAPPAHIQASACRFRRVLQRGVHAFVSAHALTEKTHRIPLVCRGTRGKSHRVSQSCMLPAKRSAPDGKAIQCRCMPDAARSVATNFIRPSRSRRAGNRSPATPAASSTSPETAATHTPAEEYR